MRLPSRMVCVCRQAFSPISPPLGFSLIDSAHFKSMEITRVKIVPSDEDNVAAYASITIDDCFAIHRLSLKISKQGDYFLFMPQIKRTNGKRVDVVAPLDNETRRMIEEKVFAAYQVFADESEKPPVQE